MCSCNISGFVIFYGILKKISSQINFSLLIQISTEMKSAKSNIV